jgi:hypothetical protein
MTGLPTSRHPQLDEGRNQLLHLLIGGTAVGSPPSPPLALHDKFTGLTQILGQLQTSNRDFQ